MARYLLNLSYIGTHFRGVQKQIVGGNRNVDDPTTVQGCIEMGLKKLRPFNDPVAVISSRTDAGVHAFHSTMHVDMAQYDGSKYDPRQLTSVLNRHFNKYELPIRILKTYLVPDSFNCRHSAISRTYMYRLVVCTGEEPIALHYIPIEEHCRALYLGGKEAFDVDKARDAAKVFVGYHDFRTFMGKERKHIEKITRKTIKMLNIEEVPLCDYTHYSWPSCVDQKESSYRSFRIHVKADGFLYRQVRRIVASLIAVAQGKVTSSDLKFMIEVPSHRSWEPKIQSVPAHGLYLCKVEYSQDDYRTFRDKN